MAIDWISRACFDVVHRNNLVYNTCWEDPRVDRVALDLSPKRRCAGDYVGRLQRARLCARRCRPRPCRRRQSAAKRPLGVEAGRHPPTRFRALFRPVRAGPAQGLEQVYASQLRRELSPSAQNYWDRRGGMASSPETGRRNSFYFHGSCGLIAYLASGYISREPPPAKRGPGLVRRQDGRRTADNLRIAQCPRNAVSSALEMAAPPRRDLRAAWRSSVTTAAIGHRLHRRNRPVHHRPYRDGLRAAAALRQLLLARLHDGPLFAQLLPGILAV